MQLNAIQNWPQQQLQHFPMLFAKKRSLHFSHSQSAEGTDLQYGSTVMELCLCAALRGTFLPCEYSHTLCLAQIPSRRVLPFEKS